MPNPIPRSQNRKPQPPDLGGRCEKPLKNIPRNDRPMEPMAPKIKPYERFSKEPKPCIDRPPYKQQYSSDSFASNCGKITKNQNNQQLRSESSACGCSSCCNTDEASKESGVRFNFRCAPSPEQPLNNCNQSPKQPEEEDPCTEFFEIMRETMEDAVKKSIEEIFGEYFNACMEKVDKLACMVNRNESNLKNFCTDLNDKISYYGERNAQQFQYLCMRMEQDRVFYQQQQECLLKPRIKKTKICKSDKQISEERQKPTFNCNLSMTATYEDEENLTIVGKQCECIPPIDTGRKTEEEYDQEDAISQTEENISSSSSQQDLVDPNEYHTSTLKITKSRISRDESIDKLLRISTSPTNSERSESRKRPANRN